MSAAITAALVGAGTTIYSADQAKKRAEAASQGAGLQSYVDPAQAKEQYKNVQAGLANQNQFLTALQGQNGVQNQSDVYNQLAGVAAGTGPNPAQAMLANTTAANTANQAALMASQRGTNANAGLIARQAGMVGAQNQQQAAGQAAALQAQQSLNAINSMGGIAGQQVGNLANATNNYTQAAQNANNSVLTGGQAQNSALVANQGLMNQGNAAQAGMYGNLMGNAANATGTALQTMFGGKNTNPTVGNTNPLADQANLYVNTADQLNNQAQGPRADGTMVAFAQGGDVKKGPRSKVGAYMCMANGGKVPALVSPGEKYLPPSAVSAVRQGANPMSVGQTIPGKPQVGGNVNSYKNDTVPMTLEEGGIVLPRSVTEAKNPSKAAEKFVSALMKQKSLRK